MPVPDGSGNMTIWYRLLTENVITARDVRLVVGYWFPAAVAAWSGLRVHGVGFGFYDLPRIDTMQGKGGKEHRYMKKGNRSIEALACGTLNVVMHGLFLNNRAA